MVSAVVGRPFLFTEEGKPQMTTGINSMSFVQIHRRKRAGCDDGGVVASRRSPG